jgi:uncharacterized membrane protein YjjP (DUF1212 family)
MEILTKALDTFFSFKAYVMLAAITWGYWFYHMFRGNWIALVIIAPAALLGYLTWRSYRRMISQP